MGGVGLRKPPLELMPLGIVIGFIFGMILAAVIDSGVAAEVKSNWVDFATISAVIFAAYLALLSTTRQIATGREENERSRLRSLTMSKAMLPNALSEMMTTARNGIKFNLVCTHNQIKDCDCVRDFNLSPKTLEAIASLIGDAEPSDAEILAKLVRMFQALKAQEERAIKGRFFPTENLIIVMTGNEKLDRAVTWAEMHSRVSSVYDFVDGNVDKIPGPLASGLRSAFLQSDCHFIDANPDLLEKISQRALKLTNET